MIRVLSFLLALALASCTTTDDTYDVTLALLFPDRQPLDTRFQTAADRGARQLKLSLLKFGQGSLILHESTRDGVDTWITADGAAIETRDQMLVGMKGFGAGLLAVDASQSLAMLRSGRQGTVERFHTYLTGDDKTVTRTYLCQIVNQGTQEIVIGASPVRARLVSEDCRSLDQAFRNLYWLEPGSNRILQASQWTGDFIGMVATQVVP